MTLLLLPLSSYVSGRRRLSQDVNKVQLDIRTGHAQTVEKVLGWLKEDGGVQNVSVADCGCGTGSLAVPLALEGAAVSASDISAVRSSLSSSSLRSAFACASWALALLCGCRARRLSSPLVRKTERVNQHTVQGETLTRVP